MLPTKSVPWSPSAIARAFGTLSANTPIENPGGSFILSSGSFCALTVAVHASRARRAQRVSHLIRAMCKARNCRIFLHLVSSHVADRFKLLILIGLAGLFMLAGMRRARG